MRSKMLTARSHQFHGSGNAATLSCRRFCLGPSLRIEPARLVRGSMLVARLIGSLGGSGGGGGVLQRHRTCQWPSVMAPLHTDRGDPTSVISSTTLALAGLICEHHRSGRLEPPEAVQRGQVITGRPSKSSSQCCASPLDHAWHPARSLA